MKKIIQISAASVWCASLIVGAVMLMTGIGNLHVACALFIVPFAIGLGILATQ